MVEEDDRLLERVQLKLVLRQAFFGDECRHLKSRTGFDASGSEVSSSDMNEKSAEAGESNDTDSGGRIVSEIVT